MNRFCWLAASLVPVLGATRTLTQGASIALCLVGLTLAHQVLLVPLRQQLTGMTLQLASLLIIAALASCLQLGLRAWTLPIALILGFYPALLCLACVAIDGLLPTNGRSRQLLLQLSGMVVVLLLMGASRQWLNEGLNLHLASLAPGALLILGLLLALYNRLRPTPPPTPKESVAP
ncbi:NADH:quinone oxidoreductase [Pseudomonas sp. Teo4]|uniref:NADH:quinone oxidoreductase n=1 Tax=Pseudomonas sp. Teo4 TaxID=3064528 RepID=UPI002ABB3704|nr:NADH:quinone oxidoreductase [Pseudomonas sp. Teo4]MDZ3995784.1 hypothetical protein [Pseudomonas sp. Teo4]